MIVDCLGNCEKYHFGKDWEIAFEFLMSLTPDIKDGEYPLKGKEIFALVMSYETRDSEKAVLEAHRKYVDIQTVISGRERIEWFPTDTLLADIEYDESKDAEFYNYPDNRPTKIDIYPDTFVALFPQDAHMPSLMVGNSPELIKKVVVKLQLD